MLVLWLSRGVQQQGLALQALARATVLRMARRSPRLVQSLGSRHRNIYFGSMKPVVLKAALRAHTAQFGGVLRPQG